MESFILDPGEDPQKILDFVNKNSLKVSMIIATHGHFDHVNAVPVLKEKLDVPFAMHEDDQYLLSTSSVSFMRFLGYDAVKVKPDRLYHEGDVFNLGESSIKVIGTPGHTPGSSSLYCEREKSLFSGDTLFRGDVGRTDFPKGSSKQIVESINGKLFALPDDTCVYPGHGGFTDIGTEKKGLDLSYLM